MQSLGSSLLFQYTCEIADCMSQALCQTGKVDTSNDQAFGRMKCNVYSPGDGKLE